MDNSPERMLFPGLRNPTGSMSPRARKVAIFIPSWEVPREAASCNQPRPHPFG